ncbi:MAG: ABC transporter permease [Vicinamibacteraceae bacterium]
MNEERAMRISDRWFRLLRRCYPPDFRDDMGEALVETYRDRARDAVRAGGLPRLARLWVRALVDAVRNGPGERLRPAAPWRRHGDWGRDAEMAMRRLVRARTFAATTILTLAIGLGMVAVALTLVGKTLLEPMPYREPADLYYVWRDYGPIRDLQRGSLSGSDVSDLKASGAVVEDVALLQPMLGGIFAAREGDDPAEIAVTVATPNLFDVLGVTPMLGRAIAPSEAGPGRPNLIVLTHPLWNRIGADPSIVGRDVRLQGNAYIVVGVLPPTFAFVRMDQNGVGQRVDAYIATHEAIAAERPDRGNYTALVRARSGASPGAVASAIAAAGRAIDARAFNGRGLSLYAVGLQDDVVAKARPALILVGAAGALLALMLTVNLASVLLARGAQREHEFAVSRALGASTAAVIRATLLEGGLLGLAGGALGAVGAAWATKALVALAPLDFPRRDAIAVDWTIAAVMIALGATLGLLAGAAPAGWASRATLSSLLASSAVRGGGGHTRLRRALVVAQVAITLVLLGSGGLVVRSVERLLRADPGFNAAGVLTFRVRSPPEFFSTPADLVGFQDRVERELRTIPGVSDVSATSTLPLSGSVFPIAIRIAGAPGSSGTDDRDATLVDVIGTRASYVSTMGMRVISGRAFDPVRQDGRQEALIDQRLAERFFPAGNAIGATIPRDGTRVSARLTTAPANGLTIVGVVQQARLDDVHQDGRPQLYIRTEDWGFRPLSFVVRSGRDPEAIVPEARAALRRADPRVAMGDVRSMAQIVGDIQRRPRTSAVVVASFALGALLLAAMGLFGIVSNAVSRRSHEMAVRLALGADHGRILRLILGEGSMLVGLGVLFGLPGLYAVSGLIRGALVGISPADPLTLSAVTVVLAAITMAACYVPARRVLGIDPARSLRQE